MNNVISLIISVVSIAIVIASYTFQQESGLIWGIPIAAVGLLFGKSIYVINEWQRIVKLRLGRFQSILKPGIAFIIPGFEQIAGTIDMRIRSTPFAAEKTLTRDTVPVDVDAVLFWVVTDANKAVLEIEDYKSSVIWVAQTTLREVIGQATFVTMISERKKLDEQLQKSIDEKTSEWGITVQSVEIKDVRIPQQLEDSMSRKAQADREREARIILAEAEVDVAHSMNAAAEVYRLSPNALQLRAMNMTYESIKEGGALMVIPSSMNESLSGITGMASSAFRHNSEKDAKVE